MKEVEILLSRLGVAKYHLYTEGVKFSRRRKRMKKSIVVEEPDADLLAIQLIVRCPIQWLPRR